MRKTHPNRPFENENHGFHDHPSRKMVFKSCRDGERETGKREEEAKEEFGGNFHSVIVYTSSTTLAKLIDK